MNWNPKYGLLLLFCTVVSYFASILISKCSKKENKKIIVLISILLILSVLFYFKYFNFFLDCIYFIFDKLHISIIKRKFDIVLPVGISFFTFQAIGYLVDVYRKDVLPEYNFFKYALFVSFFPQLVAGPIERSKNLLAQLNKVYSFDFSRIKNAFFLVLYGLFLKIVIADRAAILVDYVFQNSDATGIQVAFAVFIFAFQIYCDFYGYSIIALGCSKMIGIDLMNNFESPYFSKSNQEFWRRWHISLSSWFKDYLYIPLGGGRCSKTRKRLNVFIVMLVSGIWHGAGTNFIIWGALNGLFQIYDDIIKSIRKRIPDFLQIIINFISICFAWLFFRSKDIQESCNMIHKIIFNFDFFSLYGHFSDKYNLNGKNILVLFICICFLMLLDYFKIKNFSFIKVISKSPWILQALIIVLSVLFILVFGIWGNNYNASSFIYFQF